MTIYVIRYIISEQSQEMQDFHAGSDVKKGGVRMANYRVIARAKDSKCPYVKEGDRIVIEGTMVNLKETDSLCAVALGAIQYSLFMMGKAEDPRDFGRQDTYVLQCPDPETRVMFEISRTRLKD
jgi:uncharacterized repeat protein (TIGR04076 family)